MEERLDAGYYTNLAMFEGDFKLMMDNCKLYNGPESGKLRFNVLVHPFNS